MRFRSLALVPIIALAACSGGGGGSAPVPAPAPTASSSSGAITNPAFWPNSAKMSFSFHAKKAGTAKKSPAYVSSGSTEVVITVNTVNGGAPPSWVPTPVTTALTDGGNCSTTGGGVETCTVTAPAPPGTVNYTIATDDGTNTLSTYTGDQSITQGVVNNLSITLGGVVHDVGVSGARIAANVASDETLDVEAQDASGNPITPPGDYANPITLHVEDLTGAVMLSLNGGTPATSIVVSSPNDVVTLLYSGQAVNRVNFTATATGMTDLAGGYVLTSVHDVAFTGTTLDDTANGGLVGDANYGQQTVFFSQASGTQSISASELGFTNSPFSQQFDVTLSAACGTGNIASVSSGPATTFTITASGTPGVCSGQLTEHGTGYPLTGHPANVAGNPTQNGTFWISVTTSSFGINHTHAH